MMYRILRKSLIRPASAALLLLSWTACKKDDPPEDMNIPRVEFTSPLLQDRGSLLRDVTFTVEAVASGDKTIDRVEFFLDDVPLAGGVDPSFPFEHVRVFTEKFGVPRKVTAFAYDNLGYSDSTSIFVTVFNGVRKADPPTSRYGFSTDIVGDKIYVIGGSTPNQNVVEMYDPATNTWTTKTPATFGHFAHASCVIDGLIYVFGGQDGGPWTTNVEAYDPAADTWTTKAPIPADMGVSIGMNAAATANGKAYLMGGLVNPTPARIAEYDPAADSWRLTNSYKLQFNGRALSLNNTIYFLGGCSFQALGYCDEPSDSLQIYDPVNDAWINKAPMPIAHTGHAVTTHNGKIYVMGGSPQHVGMADRDFGVYDPATDSWRQLPPIPEPLINFGAAGANGMIYILGPESLIEHTPE